MSMTYKERFRRAIYHEAVDRLPTQINYTSALGEQMASHYRVSVNELPDVLGNHMIRVDLDTQPRTSDDGRIKYDWWGVGFDAQEEGYFASLNPLSGDVDLDTYHWPDPRAPRLLERARDIVRRDAGQHFILPNIGFALFERAWALRGLDTFLMDMAINPGFAEALLDRIVGIQQVLIRRYIDLGVDGGYFGDDYGAQKNMLFSPKMWRRLIKPRLERLFEPFREAGLPVLMHSDGQIQAIIPDLIEIGLTALNPVQPEVLDHTWLKGTFGDSLAYYGGISTQTVLPDGSPDDIRAVVDECQKHLAPDGTGLVIAPSHRMMTDISMENIETLVDAFRALGV